MSSLEPRARDYWNAFYAGRLAADPPDEPSSFAKWVWPELDSDAPVVDVGFGNGRDALWFSSQGLEVHGYDFADSAVQSAAAKASARGLTAEFSLLDLNSHDDVNRVGGALRSLRGPTVYGRFLLHALTDRARTSLFDLMAALPHGCQFRFEFRTGRDAATKHVFGEDHYRNYLAPDAVESELISRGASLVERIEGFGLAPHRDEDPHICRLVGTMPPASSEPL